MYYVGQKVVCVNDRFPPILFEFAFQIPKKGKVYTVRRKGNCVHAVTQRREVGLRFFELINPIDRIRGEASFSAWRFRPWEEQLSAEDRAERFEPVFVEVRHDVGRRLEMEVSS